jgi:TFIIS helical bundle-like domain
LFFIFLGTNPGVCQVTTQLLKDTAAGKKVRKLAKHGNSDIVAAATSVIEAWKETVRKEQGEDPRAYLNGRSIWPLPSLL